MIFQSLTSKCFSIFFLSYTNERGWKGQSFFLTIIRNEAFEENWNGKNWLGSSSKLDNICETWAKLRIFIYYRAPMSISKWQKFIFFEFWRSAIAIRIESFKYWIQSMSIFQISQTTFQMFWFYSFIFLRKLRINKALPVSNEILIR